MRKRIRGPGSSSFPTLLRAAAAVAGGAMLGCGGSGGRSVATPAPPAVTVAGYVPATPERLAAAGWRTDLSRTEVPLAAIRTRGLSPDAVVPITEPRHAAARDVDLDPAEPVLVVRGRDGVRAWPLAHLLKRELALDETDGMPVAVTFCSVCGTARVWDRRVGDRVLDLGVSGMLLEGNSLLFDRGTESLWRQVDGRAVAGATAGATMRGVPAFVVSFGALTAARPDARVMLSPDPVPDPPFRTLTGAEVARGEPPEWLGASCSRPLEPVLAAGGGDVTPVAGPVVENLGDVVVFRDPRSGTPFRDDVGGPSAPWGAAAAFLRTVDGRRLTFVARGGGPGEAPIITDEETGTVWSPLGEAVEGPLSGRSLSVVEQVAGFRFALIAP